MSLPPKTVIAILKFVEQHFACEAYNYTQDLLRLEETASSPRDMFEFQVYQHLSRGLNGSPSDLSLTTFNFDGFSRQYLEERSDKYIILTNIAKWAIQSIYSPYSNSILINALHSGSDEPINLFLSILHNEQFDSDYKVALFEFISFGRNILRNAFKLKEQPQSTKILSTQLGHILMSVIYKGSVLDGLDICCAIMYDCLSFSDSEFIDKRQLNKATPLERKSSLWSTEKSSPLSKKVSFNPVIRHSSTTSVPSFTHSIALSSASPSISSAIPATSISPPSAPYSPLILPGNASTTLFEPTPSLLFSSRSDEIDAFSLIQDGNLERFNDIILSKINKQDFLNNTFTFYRRSFLHVAVLNQKTDFIHLLYKYNVSISNQDKLNQTALHYAAKWNKFDGECFAALMSHPDAWRQACTITDSKGNTAYALMIKSKFSNDFMSFNPNAIQEKTILNLT